LKEASDNYLLAVQALAGKAIYQRSKFRDDTNHYLFAVQAIYHLGSYLVAVQVQIEIQR
jgi:hypothetical protein